MINLSDENLSDDEKLLVSRITDMTRYCSRTFLPKFSFFLDERQQAIAESVVIKNDIQYKFWGGHEKALRKVLGVFPEFYTEEDVFPIVPLTIRYRESDTLSHRDFLGSFMSKQIARNMVGDIIVNDGYTVAFIYNGVHKVILDECLKIGSVGVKVTDTEVPNILLTESFTEINGTVSSLRLDSVAALALKISREKVCMLIKNGNVSLRHEIIQSASKMVNEGDIFSVRGYGKFILYSVGSKTKKDRTHICIKKYV